MDVAACIVSADRWRRSASCRIRQDASPQRAGFLRAGPGKGRRAVTFAELREANLKTSRAWAIRELFREYWEPPGEVTRRLFFGEWHAWAARCRLGPMVKTAKRLKRHLERLVTWFDYPITNASSEGFNSVIQGLKTAARGFRSFANYRIRILFRCGRLDTEPVTRPLTSH